MMIVHQQLIFFLYCINDFTQEINYKLHRLRNATYVIGPHLNFPYLDKLAFELKLHGGLLAAGKLSLSVIKLLLPSAVNDSN